METSHITEAPSAPQLEPGSDPTAVPASEVAKPLPEKSEAKASEIVFPSFFNTRSDGLYVDAVRAAADTQFTRFVDGLFAEGFCFSGLDYAVFSRLLYPDAGAATSKVEWLKISNRVAAFPEPRRALYKNVKIKGDAESAEYLFEPVFTELEEGEADTPSPAPPAQPVPAKLVFDEFVAHLWGQGVRAGLDEKTVRRVIDKGELGPIEVARWIEPTTGQDAGIKEISDALHRDNSPKQLSNGHIDLGQFKNRYPQIARNVALLKKTPRVLGQPGRKISGEIVEPALPKDFDFRALAGIGTQVEQRSDGEYIVSSMEGFLSLDTASNQVSITDKIVSHEGVSMRTTGNLSLTGDDYEEHGEVQEKRTVEGKNMTFCADVYGNLISHGGTITLKQNFSNGRASNPQGKIVVEGRASSTLVEAPGGEIHLHTAEGCTISGKHVIVENAVRCQIVAEVLELGIAEGCAVAAKAVKIGQSGARKDVEAVVSVFIPDLSDFEEQRTALNKQIAESQAGLLKSRREIEALQAQPEFAHFLTLQTKVARGEVKLSPAQQDGFKKVASRFTSQLQQLRQLTEQGKPAQAIISHAQQQLQEMEKQQTAWAQEIRCDIEAITGETVVRTMRIKFGEDLLTGSPQELLVKLRNLGEPHERLFSGGAGEFGWVYSETKPETGGS
ncbi:MAG: DUF342 domain-containing protein [Hydrogenophilales bacterium]|nr:DUF342 domain-containing protein [Hydrogenophilales bacterium]